MSVASVRARIEAARARAARDVGAVRLVGVSKGHDVEEIERVLLAEGVRDLAENRVQAWREKAEVLPHDVTWHFIGSLQRNKVKYLAARRVSWLHSLNSVRLAEELERQGAKYDHVFRALIEVNVAGEEAKQGVDVNALASLLDAARALPHVEVRGLMAMAPFSDDPEDARPTFRELRTLADRWGLEERSMGMSGDFEVAVEEGATMVRVGSALFTPDASGYGPSMPNLQEGAGS